MSKETERDTTNRRAFLKTATLTTTAVALTGTLSQTAHADVQTEETPAASKSRTTETRYQPSEHINAYYKSAAR